MSRDEHLPLIAVAGASSKQGRSVVGSLLESGRYRVRALTRDTGGATARWLATRGAEVVHAPLAAGHRATLEQAFRGAHGAFLMTPPMPPAPPPEQAEFALGRVLADAAVAAGVRQVVWSSLENVASRTGGRKWAPHFTEKALVEEHVRGLPVTASFVQLAFFYSNFLEYYVPVPAADGVLDFAVYLPPDVPVPFVDPLTATGPAVRAMFDDPGAYSGQTLPVVGEVLTARQLVDTFVRVTGRPARYVSAYRRDELLQRFPAFAGDPDMVRELVGMVEYAVEFGYFAPDRDVDWSRRNDPGTLDWAAFLARTGWRGEPVRYGAEP